jgi:hypothetical protein
MRIMSRICRLGAAVLLVVTAGAIVGGCEDDSTEPPRKDVPGGVENFEIFGTAHTGVLLRWEKPVLGNPRIDGYYIYFDPGEGLALTRIGGTAYTTYIHDSWDAGLGTWVTGTYCITAYNDEGEGERSKSLSTFPKQSVCAVLWELDRNLAAPSSERAGILFNDDGYAMDISVMSFADATSIEFYLTDFAVGCCDPGGLYLCSMAYGSYQSPDADRIGDFGGELRESGFLDTANSHDFPVVVNSKDGSPYATIMRLNEDYLSIYTSDHHYAVVRLCGPINPADPFVELEFWYSPIEDYGVLAHEWE